MGRPALCVGLLASALLPAALASNIQFSVSNTSLDSLQALNLGGYFETELPDGIVLGTEYHYNAARKAFPDKLYVRFRGEGPVETSVHLGLIDPVVALDITAKPKPGTVVKASLDSKTWIPKTLEALTKVKIGGQAMTLNPKCDFRRRSSSLKTSVNIYGPTPAGDCASAELFVKDPWSSKRDAWMKVRFQVNEHDDITPVISLLDGSISYEWLHRLQPKKGFVRTIFKPAEKLSFEWKDPGSRGSWTTKANVPLKAPSQSTVSFSRSFDL